MNSKEIAKRALLRADYLRERKNRRQKALKVIAVFCGFAAALLIPLSVAHAANEDIPAPSPGTPEVAVSTGGVLEAGHAY